MEGLGKTVFSSIYLLTFKGKRLKNNILKSKLHLDMVKCHVHK